MLIDRAGIVRTLAGGAGSCFSVMHVLSYDMPW